jgi:aspartyl-tRNA(Asn)/glutamyl-tRNA(Gln) amidotransferase subunit A
MSAPNELGVGELLRAFRAETVTASDAVDSCLERISQVDGSLGAVQTLEPAKARRLARLADSNWRQGRARPLEGVPFGAKDIICTAGVRTTAGSPLLEQYVPGVTASVIERLQNAGAICLGKLRNSEFAIGTTAATRNPWDLDYWPGGSSSGPAAAVAAREVPFALGSDTGGSIIIPSALCGIQGLKPTYGRVPRHGVLPLSWTLDHVGPMARCAEDLARVLQAIAGYDERDPTSGNLPVPDYFEGLADGVGGLRVGIPSDWFFDRCHPRIYANVTSVAERLARVGAEIKEVNLPATERVNPDIAQQLILFSEMAALHAEYSAREKEYGREFRKILLRSQFISSYDYIQALRSRHVLQRDFEKAFEAVDALLIPAVVYRTPRMDNLVADLGSEVAPLADVIARTTAIFDLVGIPTVTVPVGLDPDSGLPTGVQLAARPYAEGTCLQLAQAIERLVSFSDKRPPLADTSRRGPGESAPTLDDETIWNPVLVETESDLW